MGRIFVIYFYFLSYNLWQFLIIRNCVDFVKKKFIICDDFKFQKITF